MTRRHTYPEQIDALVSVTGDIAQAKKVLQVLGIESALAHLERTARHEFARHLLAQRTPRADVVRRIQTRYAVTARTAQRDIGEALNLGCSRQ